MAKKIRRIGKELFKVLDKKAIFPTEAFTRPENSYDLWIRFAGPPEGLGIPFELLRNDDFLSLSHLISRKIIRRETSFNLRSEPFFRFIEHLNINQDPLKVLIIGANSDGNIPDAEKEADLLADSIKKDLDQIGLKEHIIKKIVGEEAKYGYVKDILENEKFHILHFAGHGRFSDKLPEISGLILKDGAFLASTLKTVLQNNELRLVFLSCCLGARTGQDSGRGDFSEYFRCPRESPHSNGGRISLDG